VLSAGAVASFPAAAQYRSVRCRARFVSGLGFSQAAIRPPTPPAREGRRMQMSFAFAEGAGAFTGCGKTPWARSFVSGREFTRAASCEKSVWGFGPCGMFSHRQPRIRPFPAACSGPRTHRRPLRIREPRATGCRERVGTSFERRNGGFGAQSAFTGTDRGLPFRHDPGLQIPRLRYSPGLAPTTRLNALLNAASDS
jgi:hypothetical protein